MLNEKGLEAVKKFISQKWFTNRLADAVGAVEAYLSAASPEAPEDVAGVEPVAWRVRPDPGFPWTYQPADPERNPLTRDYERQPLYPASALTRIAAERDRQYDENAARIAAEGAAILRAEAAEAEAATLRARIAELEGKVERIRDCLPTGHTVLEAAEFKDGRVAQTVRIDASGEEYERIVSGEEAYGAEGK